MLIGIPGKSNAFAISKKLGLDNSILKRAEDLITSDNINIEELLKNIYDDKIQIEKEKEEITKNLKQIEHLRKNLENENSKLKEKESSILDKAKQEARKILLDAKDKVSNAIQEINKTYKNIDVNSVSNLNNIRNSLNSSIKNTASNVAFETTSKEVLNAKDISVGMKVYARNLNQSGTILTLPNKSNLVQIQFDNAKMMVDIKHLEKSKESNTLAPHGSSHFKTNKSKTATTEINVIGYNVEEAIFTIDKYLDDCSLAKLKNIRIVHGKGTGILRKGIHEFLKKNSHVKSFRLGTFGEGEMGVTIVELK